MNTIVYEDKKIQVLVDDKTSTLYFHRKFQVGQGGFNWGPAVRITPANTTEITIESKEHPVQVNMRPK